VEYQQATQPKSGGAWNSFKLLVYNPQTKTVFGRTCSSWGKITVFYLIYYGLLAAFFACSLLVFFETLDDVVPRRSGMQSILKGNPGMGFRPMPNLESTLVKFTQGDPDSYEKYVEHISDYLKEYEEVDDNAVDCDVVDPEPGQVCRFDPNKEAGPCTKENNFGYHEGEPCILLKLNRIYGWEPEPFTNETINEDNDHARAAKEALNGETHPDYISITCEGENPGDVDNRGEVKFYPNLGFPMKYFPFMNQKGYQTPVVFAQFEQPRPGVIIQVWCKVWAKNVYHHKNDKAGSIHLELYMN
jgi:sodium/potassium-transporting ATPase subunit beta